MALTANDIITKSRYSVSDDINKSRWTDDYLLSLTNDALLDIASTTRLYSSSAYVPLEIGTSLYDLSNKAISIERVEYVNLPLDFITFGQMDRRFGRNWQDDTDEIPTHVIYDLLQPANFRIYPTPAAGNRLLHRTNSIYGIITDIQYQDVELELAGPLYGDIDIDTTKYVLVYFIKMPPKVTALTDILDPLVDRQHIHILAHYVTSYALRSNQDTLSIKLSGIELQRYEMGKKNLAHSKNVNNVRRIRTTKYRSSS